MSILEAIVLGIVQGLTEFLPVSSSGHLVIFQSIFNTNEEIVMTFDIALHFGTLLAVLYVYRKKVWEMIRHPFSKLPMYLVLGTVPTVVITLLLKDAIENTYKGTSLLGPGFIFTGIVLILSGKIANGKKEIGEMSPLDTILIGTGQGIALLPSISRSGMTIATGLALGLEKGFAADYAFLLSIPAILGGMVLSAYEFLKGDSAAISTVGIAPFAIGIITAAITGFFAIKLMLAAVKKMKMKYFAIYVIALGILILIGQVFFSDAVGWLRDA
jgi:undecaprenyl-diphosphatase